MTAPLCLRALRVAHVSLFPAESYAQELTARLPEARALDRFARDKEHSPGRAVTSELLADRDAPRR
jgi:hypothetical protein